MKIRVVKKYSLKWPLKLTSKLQNEDRKFRHINWSIAKLQELRRGDK